MCPEDRLSLGQCAFVWGEMHPEILYRITVVVECVITESKEKPVTRFNASR